MDFVAYFAFAWFVFSPENLGASIAKLTKAYKRELTQPTQSVDKE